MPNRIDEIEATVHPVILNVPTVQSRLIAQVLVVLLIHIVNDRLPTEKREQLGTWRREGVTNQALLSTASPNPGVSTTVSLNLTPFSSMSTVVASILTVCLMRSAGGE